MSDDSEVTSCIRSANWRCRYCYCGSSDFLLARAHRKSGRPVSEPPGSSRETPYAFLNLARCRCKGWKEFLLLRWSTNCSNVAALTGRSIKDHLHQRPPDQAEGDLRHYSVHGYDEFAFSRPDGFS